MRLDLRDVRGPSHAVNRAFPHSAFGSDDTYAVAAPVDLSLHVRKKERMKDVPFRWRRSMFGVCIYGFP